MEQVIRFIGTHDAGRLAYATYGDDRGRPLIFMPSWFSQEAIWRSSHGRAFLEALGAGRRLITYDARGFGASDRTVPEGVSVIEAHANDLADLVAALKLESVDLFASVETRCAEAIVFAATHPERVRRLVLWSPIAPLTPYPESARRMIADNWLPYTRFAATQIAPTGGEVQRWYTQAIRDTTTPEHVVREVSENLDVGAIAARVGAPTLVLRRVSDQHANEKAVRAFCANMPDARFVAPQGDAHDLMWQFEQHIGMVTAFLDEGSELAQGEQMHSPMRTVLFTDIVGHTEMMSRLGDTGGREVLREHERITREVLAAHAGREVKTMGDGFMASFGSVTAATECAVALQRAFDEAHGPERIAVRVGLNAGEPIEEDGDLFGATVILASRICARAGPGEILVPDTVRGLLSGKGFVFADRGEFVPKGFEDGVRLFEVRWRE